MEAGLGVGKLRRELIELQIVRMNEHADLAEGQQLFARLQSEDLEHRVRPENAAARKIPVPQAAPAAIERRVDARAHGVVDHVGFARPRCLPMERKSEDQQHEAGGGEQRDGERRVGPPGAQRTRT